MTVLRDNALHLYMWYNWKIIVTWYIGTLRAWSDTWSIVRILAKNGGKNKNIFVEFNFIFFFCHCGQKIVSLLCSEIESLFPLPLTVRLVLGEEYISTHALFWFKIACTLACYICYVWWIFRHGSVIAANKFWTLSLMNIYHTYNVN